MACLAFVCDKPEHFVSEQCTDAIREQGKGSTVFSMCTLHIVWTSSWEGLVMSFSLSPRLSQNSQNWPSCGQKSAALKFPLACRIIHRTMKISLLVWSVKSSIVLPGQWCSGGPGQNARCRLFAWLCSFFLRHKLPFWPATCHSQRVCIISMTFFAFEFTPLVTLSCATERTFLHREI